MSAPAADLVLGQISIETLVERGIGTIKVAVYRFSVWNHQSRENITVPRMGTREAIELAGGVPDAEAMLLVPEPTWMATAFMR